GQEVRIALVPMADVHLRSEASGEISATTNLQYLYIFAAIAILVLIIACINYVNLATARAIDRAREVGLRKVVGAQRGEVFGQFMGEATLITLLATILGLGLVYLGLPLLSDITGRALSLEQVMTPGFFLTALGIMLLVIFLAGGYPALILANYTPIKVLRGTFRTSKSGAWLRNGLVVFQFGVSTFLIVGTLVIYQQLKHVQQVRLGYDKEHLVSLPMDRTITEKLKTIKGELVQHPEIVSVTAASESPVEVGGGYNITDPAQGGREYSVQAIAVDEDFVKTVGLEIIAGADYTPSILEGEEMPFLLNETTMRMMGLSEADLGKKLALHGRQGYLYGVIKDFHFASLHQPIGPLVLFPEDQYNEMLVRLSAGPVPEALEALAGIWTEVAPHRPFNYTFLDDSYKQLYQTEQQAGTLLTAFSIVAIAIACLGLLGLAAFTAVRRSKEIGIRKVLGATEWQMVGMLSGDFTKWVGLAILISLPLSWYLMNDWLSQFAYRINVGWEILLGASLVSLLIAWLTVGYQAYRTASLSPSMTLRDE
ncbi:MAG: FtsX-like permease family protein, partial [Bacteroidota bacterium]